MGIIGGVHELASGAIRAGNVGTVNEVSAGVPRFDDVGDVNQEAAGGAGAPAGLRSDRDYLLPFLTRAPALPPAGPAHEFVAHRRNRWYWDLLRFGQTIVITCPILIFRYFNHLVGEM